MPFPFTKKKKKDDEAAADPAVAAAADRPAVQMKGDLEVREYPKATHDPRLLDERAYFERKLKELSGGYVSKRTLNDFKVIKTLGTGSFGRVLLCDGKGFKHEYQAMKIISKERVIKTRQVEHTINEKNILFCTDFPFVVKLFDYFTDKQALYFVLEFVNGGEMFTHIQKQKRRRFTEEQTRFFSAETVLAFEYLHNLMIIFRDLKPENMLIDHRGHIRLTDFGFAKRVDDKTWTMCGTPEYLAPEIIVNKGYGHAVDWWAVGVLTFEMRCGHSPFEARSQMDMFKKIAKRDFQFPRDFNDEERSFIGGLLQVDLTRRLGNMVGGVGDIKKHPYFACYDFDQLLAQTVPSPYVPSVKGPGDTSNFDLYPEEPVKWHGKGADAFEDTFVGF